MTQLSKYFIATLAGPKEVEGRMITVEGVRCGIHSEHDDDENVEVFAITDLETGMCFPDKDEASEMAIKLAGRRIRSPEYVKQMARAKDVLRKNGFTIPVNG